MGNICDICKKPPEKPTSSFTKVLEPPKNIESPLYPPKKIIEDSATPIIINNNKPIKELSINDFSIVRSLGQGAFGKVLLVKKSESKAKGSKLFAMKIMKKSDILSNKLTKNIKLEKKILQYQRHPFLVHLKYAFQTSSKIYLVMEYIAGGSLGKFLRKQKRFNEDLTTFYTAEILLGLEFLHKNMNVIYRDLKPDNILINSNGHIKITDFGLAKEENPSGDLAYTFAGTPEYLAPEILCGKGHSHVVDYWSLGILIFEMLSGRTPFAVASGNVTEIIQKILENKPKIPAYFNEPAAKLIKLLLETDPTKRLGANGIEEIKSHEFFKKINWKELTLLKTKPPLIKKIEDVKSGSIEGEVVTESANNQNSMPYLSKMTYNTEMGKTLMKSVLN